MKALGMAAAALALSGCIGVRFWSYEESDRIAAVTVVERDPAHEAALEGIPVPCSGAASTPWDDEGPPRAAPKAKKKKPKGGGGSGAVAMPTLPAFPGTEKPKKKSGKRR